MIDCPSELIRAGHSGQSARTPLFDHGSESARPRLFCCADLIREPKIPKHGIVSLRFAVKHRYDIRAGVKAEPEDQLLQHDLAGNRFG